MHSVPLHQEAADIVELRELILDIKTHVTFGHCIWEALRIQDRKCQNHYNADVNKCQVHHTNI